MSFRGCLSEGVDIFLKSVEHQGESGHDVRVSRLTPWMASVGGPVIMRKTYSLFVENSHPETLHRGRMFRSPWAFVGLKLPFAMSHAIHKIVSKERCQSYFISRRSPHLSISKDSESCASAHRCLHYAYARLIARVTFYLQLCGPLGQIPDLGSQAIVEFRLMADHENTSLVFFQCPFQLVFGIHIQMVRWLVQ